MNIIQQKFSGETKSIFLMFLSYFICLLLYVHFVLPSETSLWTIYFDGKVQPVVVFEDLFAVGFAPAFRDIVTLQLFFGCENYISIVFMYLCAFHNHLTGTIPKFLYNYKCSLYTLHVDYLLSLLPFSSFFIVNSWTVTSLKLS